MDEKRLLPLLEAALRTERDGFSFYTSAAARSADAGAKEAFSHLAEEERKHFDALQTEYRAILDGSGWDPTVALAGRSSSEEAGPIFSESFRRRIAGKHLEMSVLSIGILLEKNAEAFYRSAAAEEPDPAIRGFLLELAEWEAGHYRMLTREDEALRDAYWNESRFSPLL
jgi:rubrerythrin